MVSHVEILKRQMQCSLCNDTLIEPKLVNCFHVFCKLCIKRNAEVDQQENYIFKCPHCSAQTLLQDLNDVEDLLTSPVHSRILKVLEFVENQKICSVSSSHPEALWQCLDCDRSLCEECLRYHSEFFKTHQVVSLSDLKKADIEILLKREPLCKTHDNQNVEFYCQDCDMLICTICCLKEHRHKHNTIATQDIIDTERDSLSKDLEQIDKMTSDEKEKKQQEEIALIIKKDGEKTKQQVKELTEKLVKILRNNEQQLLNKIQESMMKAEKNLRLMSHPAQAKEYIKYFMENGTASEMIDARQEKSSQNLTLNPFDKIIGGIEFKPNEELCEQVKHGLGLVRSLKKADPKTSSVKVVPSDLEATRKAKLVVELKTSEGEVTKERLENVAIQFTREDDVRVGEIQMTDDSEMTVDFIPRVAGQLTADIKLHGNPVCNSPLVMLVKPQQIKEMTGHSKLKDALNTVSKTFTGIAVNKTNSKIAVADLESHCVRVFNMEGDLLLTYGSQGSGPGQLEYPHGLAFLNETDLVISDNNNLRICIMNTTTGQLVRTFGCHGNGNGQFQYPLGVHVDDDSNIMVCDYGNSRVQVFTKDGDYLYQFSVPGEPHSIVTHNGLFYVSDWDMSVVHVIEMKDNQSPTTLTTIGGKDYTDCQLQWPRGLAIDNDNYLLVCDNGARLLHKFTLDGRYVGRSSKLAKNPSDIAVLNDGQVICTTLEGGVVFFYIQPS